MEASGINVEFLSINSKAYDVSALTLGLGQDIKMSIPELDADVRWFADNDKVLSITADGNESTISALAVGDSTILVQNTHFTTLKKIVVSVITDQAVSLGLKAGSPELK